MDIIPNWTFNN